MDALRSIRNVVGAAGIAMLLVAGCSEPGAEAAPREPEAEAAPTPREVEAEAKPRETEAEAAPPETEVGATPREVDVPSEEVPSEGPVDTSEPNLRERRDPVTPGEDGVIQPNEDRVIMPPDSLGEGIDQPDARDQLERDLVEEGVPQAAE